MEHRGSSHVRPFARSPVRPFARSPSAQSVLVFDNALLDQLLKVTIEKETKLKSSLPCLMEVGSLKRLQRTIVLEEMDERYRSANF